MKKKIIILYSTGGMGHKKAAFALLESFQKRNSEADVEIIDVLEYGNRLYRFLYLDAYIFMMTKAKWLWGALYYLSNLKFFDAITRKGRAKIDYRCLPGLGEELVEKAPDAIVATHFLLPSIAGILKEKGLASRLYAVVTDYGPHSWWISQEMDSFFVGSDIAKKELGPWGIYEEKVSVTGIPVSEEFSSEPDRGKLQEQYEVDPGRKTIFMMSGGFGVGPMERMLLALNECNADIQVIAVCGHNKEIYEDVDKMRKDLKYPMILFGFTDKVAELMAISDIMVTKAGGISVTEALDSRLPMILYASIPGQETWNEHFLTSSGAAEKAEHIKDIPVIADRMLISEDAYESYAAGIERIRKPNAAEDIAQQVMKDINGEI